MTPVPISVRVSSHSQFTENERFLVAALLGMTTLFFGRRLGKHSETALPESDVAWERHSPEWRFRDCLLALIGDWRTRHCLLTPIGRLAVPGTAYCLLGCEAGGDWVSLLVMLTC